MVRILWQVGLDPKIAAIIIVASVASATCDGTPMGSTAAAVQVDVRRFNTYNSFVGETPINVVFDDSIVGLDCCDGLEVVVTSAGRGSLIVNSIISSDSSNFKIADTCHLQISIQPGSRCWLNIMFVPTRLGRLSAFVTMSTNAGNVVFNLSGNGVSPR